MFVSPALGLQPGAAAHLAGLTARRGDRRAAGPVRPQARAFASRPLLCGGRSLASSSRWSSVRRPAPPPPPRGVSQTRLRVPALVTIRKNCRGVWLYICAHGRQCAPNRRSMNPRASYWSRIFFSILWSVLAEGGKSPGPLYIRRRNISPGVSPLPVHSRSSAAEAAGKRSVPAGVLG